MCAVYPALCPFEVHVTYRYDLKIALEVEKHFISAEKMVK